MPEFTQRPERGDIWWAALDPALGSEIKKTRPCVILSSSLVNEHRRTVLVVPLSSSPQPRPPITIPNQCQGKNGVAVVDQLRAISKKRLQGFIEKADVKTLEAITEALLTIIEG